MIRVGLREWSPLDPASSKAPIISPRNLLVLCRLKTMKHFYFKLNFSDGNVAMMIRRALMTLQPTRFEDFRGPLRGARAIFWATLATALFCILGVVDQSAQAATAQEGVGDVTLVPALAADPSAAEGVGSDAGEPQIVQRRGSDRDGNPPGPRGGRGTNWENPPGPRGGPGASPDRRARPGHRGFRDRDGNPPGPRGGRGTNWENPPGPRGGPGASPDRRMGRGAYRPRR